MGAYPRYRFDQGFGARVVAEAGDEPVEAIDPLDEPRHSERALQSALAEAREAGVADGLERGRREGEAQAAHRIEAEIVAALDGLSARLAALDGAHGALLERLEAQGALLLVALVRRMAPRLLDSVAREEVERLAGEALRAAGAAPLLRLRVHPSLSGPLEDRLAQQTAFKGRLEICPDPSLAPGALDAAWDAGGVRRDPAALDAAIADLADRALSALAPLASVPPIPSPPGERVRVRGTHRAPSRRPEPFDANRTASTTRPVTPRVPLTPTLSPGGRGALRPPPHPHPSENAAMPPLNLDILDDDTKPAEKGFDGPMSAIYNVPVDVQVVLCLHQHAGGAASQARARRRAGVGTQGG